jgi:restriction system protein
MDKITDFLKNFRKDRNNSNANKENEVICRSCGSRIKPGSSYCPECKTIVPFEDLKPLNSTESKNVSSREDLNRKEDPQNVEKLQPDKTWENINHRPIVYSDNVDFQKKIEEAWENIDKLSDSGKLIIIDNFVKKYPDYKKGTVYFEILRELLKSKQFDFSQDELNLIIHHRQLNQLYNERKAEVLANNPVNADECLRNYLKIFFYRDVFDDADKSIIGQILTDQFNYKGDIDKDIARIRTEIARETRENELKKFESELTAETPTHNQITIRDVDTISGYDFELLLKRLFEGMSYQVTHTSLSNDQGADLILEKDGTRSVVQAKNWTANVGNTAVQEIVAAVKHYDAHKAIVISSSGFTTSAIELARSNKVELWDRAKLSTILNDNPVLKD